MLPKVTAVYSGLFVGPTYASLFHTNRYSDGVQLRTVVWPRLSQLQAHTSRYTGHPSLVSLSQTRLCSIILMSMLRLTFMSDVGLALASLASIFASKGHHSLPDHIRLAGDTISYKEIKEIFQAADPEKKELVLETIPVATFEEKLKADPAALSKDPS